MDAAVEQAEAAALGGFASKMGLASGPMVAGLLLGDGSGYGLLINLGMAILALSLIASIVPALRQDRAAKPPPSLPLGPGAVDPAR